MNYLGYHKNCGGKVRQVLTKKLYISNECNRCNGRGISKYDTLEINPMPKIIHQKASGVRVKRKYYEIK